MLVFRTKCHDHFCWCFLWDAGAGSLIRGQLLKGTEAPGTGLLQALNLGVWGALNSLWFTQPFRILLKVDSSGPNLRLVIGNYCIGQLIPQKWDLETQMIVVSKCSILLSSMWIDYIISSVMGFPSIFGIYRVRFGRSQI
jgi:hypothetical protein